MPMTVSIGSTPLASILPNVLNVAVPLAGAVQRYQTDSSLKAPATVNGSPGSVVALKLFPLTVPLSPVRTVALVKLSLAGWAMDRVRAPPQRIVKAIVASRGKRILDRASGKREKNFIAGDLVKP